MNAHISYTISVVYYLESSSSECCLSLCDVSYIAPSRHKPLCEGVHADAQK